MIASRAPAMRIGTRAMLVVPSSPGAWTSLAAIAARPASALVPPRA